MYPMRGPGDAERAVRLDFRADFKPEALAARVTINL